jgi:hypothetical protein
MAHHNVTPALLSYDDVSMLGDLDEADLDAMDIKLPGHRKRFLLNCKLHKPWKL